MKINVHHLHLTTSIILIILFVPMVYLQAQDYRICFAGSGESSTITMIKVENLTQGTSITLNGDDTLHLVEIISSIDPTGYSTQNGVSFYPNPMKDYTRMQFVLPEEGETTIILHDLSGKEIYRTQDLLLNGQHNYGMEGISDGMYIMTIRSGSYIVNGRLICSGSQKGGIRIVYESTTTAKEKIRNLKSTNAGTVEMQYNPGDILKITGISDNYSTIVTDVLTADTTISFNFVACPDGDANNYAVVQIGTQTWMAENLKTTKYNDGEDIPYITDNTAWTSLTTPAYCWCNNDEATYHNTYGALYNWHTVNTGKLCPVGWHVPDDGEWNTLVNYLGGVNVAGGKLKEAGTVHWADPNTGATDEVGFTALPGGSRAGGDGTFENAGIDANWWSTKISGTTNAYEWTVGNSYERIFTWSANAKIGMSVRCLKD